MDPRMLRFRFHEIVSVRVHLRIESAILQHIDKLQRNFATEAAVIEGLTAYRIRDRSTVVKDMKIVDSQILDITTCCKGRAPGAEYDSNALHTCTLHCLSNAWTNDPCFTDQGSVDVNNE
jgi:hypothetical protein